MPLRESKWTDLEFFQMVSCGKMGFPVQKTSVISAVLSFCFHLLSEPARSNKCCVHLIWAMHYQLFCEREKKDEGAETLLAQTTRKGLHAFQLYHDILPPNGLFVKLVGKEQPCSENIPRGDSFSLVQVLVHVQTNLYLTTAQHRQNTLATSPTCIEILSVIFCSEQEWNFFQICGTKMRANHKKSRNPSPLQNSGRISSLHTKTSQSPRKPITCTRFR